jgi:hypothetical protein
MSDSNSVVIVINGHCVRAQKQPDGSIIVEIFTHDEQLRVFAWKPLLSRPNGESAQWDARLDGHPIAETIIDAAQEAMAELEE